jgi:hypothetical protein
MRNIMVSIRHCALAGHILLRGGGVCWGVSARPVGSIEAMSELGRCSCVEARVSIELGY